MPPNQAVTLRTGGPEGVDISGASLPSGDIALVVLGGDVNPLHSSQMNASLQFQYNVSGDLIFIDKVIGSTRYRRSTWKNDYTGNQTIDVTKTWTFGGYTVVV